MAEEKIRLNLAYDGSSGDPTVVAFDPGGTTGWAVVSVHPVAVRDPAYSILDNLTHVTFGQFCGTELAMADAMIDLCEQWPGAVRLTEQFILMTHTNSDALLSPVRLNAALRYGLHLKAKGTDRRVWNQTASMAKTTMTDERLAYCALIEPTRGKPHARDALRHALTFWKRVRTSYALGREAFPALFRAS